MPVEDPRQCIGQCAETTTCRRQIIPENHLKVYIANYEFNLRNLQIATVVYTSGGSCGLLWGTEHPLMTSLKIESKASYQLTACTTAWIARIAS